MWTADRIRILRKRYGETQLKFAEHFRVSVEAVRFWEQGKGEPSGPVTVILDDLERRINAMPQLPELPALVPA